MKSVFELILDLKYHAGISLFESFNLPIGLRRYYSDRLAEKFEEEREAIEKGKNRSQSHSPPQLKNK